ncbi:CTP--molybdopterin cytidylyltransferase [Brenneria salicis ATCC 15712 = DSM 30166]|nr:CTP--molybdopterin cytidylyltransferase [Brenneria salicis ATCC 15712 = DSM 30166]
MNGDGGMPEKVCVMLAAGLSSRMGEWKMMLPFQGGTVLDSALANALAFCDRVVLVTGYRGDVLQRRYAGHPRIVARHNADYPQGMFSSIRCGVAATQPGPFFLALGDMPTVTPRVYQQLWRQRDDQCLIPVHAHGKGHPVLLPAGLRAAIGAHSGDASLRQLIQDYGARLVPVDDPAIHWDMDTPRQYAQLLAHQSARVGVSDEFSPDAAFSGIAILSTTFMDCP